MTHSTRTWLHRGVLACLTLFAVGLSAIAAERRAASEATGPSVEMFAAMKSKDIAVSVIPKDETELRVMIKNNTKKPLTVKLPDAFAAMPVLAQRGGGGAVAGGGGIGGQQQTAGGGMGMGGGGMGMGMGGGMMNIPAEKVAQLKVATVCLEHGKKAPRAAVPYEIKPIEAFSSDPAVKALLVALGKGRLSQRATQAAAWNLANGMTWEQLANKRIEHLDGSSEPWFSPEEIQAGMRIAQFAKSEAEQNATPTPRSPGEVESSTVSQTRTAN